MTDKDAFFVFLKTLPWFLCPGWTVERWVNAGRPKTAQDLYGETE